MGLLFRFIIDKWKSIIIYVLMNLCLIVAFFMASIALLGVSKTVSYNPNSGLNLYSLELDGNILNNSVSEFNQIQPLSLNVLNELGESKYVQKYDVFLSEEIYSNTLKNVDYLEEPAVGVFNLRGSSSDFLIDEYLSKINIIEGIGPSTTEFYKIKNSVVLSKLVAEKNNISLGDEIDARFYTDLGMKSEDTFNFKFKVVGIYDFYHSDVLEHLVGNDKFEVQDFNHNHNHNHDNESIDLKQSVDESILRINEVMQNYRFNILYVSNETVLNFNSAYSQHSMEHASKPYYQAVFELLDKRFENDFRKLAFKKLHEPYVIKSATEEYREYLKPLDSLSLCLSMFILLIFIAWLISNFAYFNIFSKKTSEFRFLYDIGYSKEMVYDSLKNKFAYFNLILLLISIYLIYFLIRKNIMSKAIGEMVNIFSFMLDTTGTNIELLINTPNSYSFDVLTYIELDYFDYISMVLIVGAFILGLNIILKRFIYLAWKNFEKNMN